MHFYQQPRPSHAHPQRGSANGVGKNYPLRQRQERKRRAPLAGRTPRTAVLAKKGATCREQEHLKREFGYSSSTAWRIAFRMNRNCFGAETRPSRFTFFRTLSSCAVTLLRVSVPRSVANFRHESFC